MPAKVLYFLPKSTWLSCYYLLVQVRKIHPEMYLMGFFRLYVTSPETPKWLGRQNGFGETGVAEIAT